METGNEQHPGRDAVRSVFFERFFRCACVRSFVTVKPEGGIVTILYRFRRKDYHV